MKIPLTTANLLHQRVRTLIALAGVAFAVVLVFMQLGFYGSAERTATIFLDRLDGDLVLVSADYLDINRPGTFPRTRLYQALAADGVDSVAPVYVAANLWRIADDLPAGAGDEAFAGRRRTIMVVGFPLGERVFRGLPELHRQVEKLKVPDTVLIDTHTRPVFGERGPGVETDLGAVRVKVVGEFSIGTGYGADGLVLMSEQTFSDLFGRWPLDRISLGLVRLKPGANPGQVADAVAGLLPADEVGVLTRDELNARERDYWVNKTAVGKIFTLGVAVALIVGTVFVYQVISGDIHQRLAEYATLKAIGYGPGFLSGLVIRQALIYGVLGYLPGLLLALVLYRVAAAAAHLPIAMTWGRALAVLGLAVGMCAVSGLLAMQKVKSADPADLF